VSPPAPAGYSGTPLAKKLGIGAGARVYLAAAPPDYEDLLRPIPEGVRFVDAADADVDLAHVFATRRAALEPILRGLRARLRAEVPTWVSWPKKAAKLDTDLTEDVVRELALPMGFVDVKVCAVDATWSALRLVVRKALRT
jgi:hypothetical protein